MLLPQSSIKLEDRHGHSGNLNKPPPPGEPPFKKPRLRPEYYMDAPRRPPRSDTTLRRDIGRLPRTTSASASDGQHRPGIGRAANTLRRGHSDGDVLDRTPSSSSRRDFADSTSEEGQSWMDFINEAGELGFSNDEALARAARKADLVAADWKRRFSTQQGEHARRSSNSLSLGHAGINRPRHSLGHSTSDRPLSGPLRRGSNFPSPRIQDRPLLRRPSNEGAPNHRNRDIRLPRWQPDAEASKCPICSTIFSLWYRKHHCRKCGRVVCANCSPHRITIPRQFIVHPPEDASTSPITATNSGIDIIDLTGDDDVPEPAVINSQRPQSSDYKIDPALGGGQEVRLCNPCVPDPNPLPHVPYPPSSHQSSINSLPQNGPPNSRHSDIPVQLSLSEISNMTAPRHSLSGRNNPIFGFPATFENTIAPFPSVTPSNASSSTNHRYSHASRPHDSQASPFGLPTVYGSAPDQAAHQVRT